MTNPTPGAGGQRSDPDGPGCHDVVVEVYDGVDISMRCIPCRERIAIKPESAAASLHELQRLANDHVGVASQVRTLEREKGAPA